MATFIIGLVILLGGAALYGRFCEKVFGPDDRKTPPVDSAETLRRVSEELLAAADFHGRKIRLIGLTVGNSPEACPECVQLRFDFGNPEP